MSAIDRTKRSPGSQVGGIIGAVCGLLLLAALALLAACGGATSPSATYTPQPGSTPASAYAYLYSRIDYPLEVAVDAGSTVTLTLSPQSNLLIATPSAGSGVGVVGEPIPLPTQLSDYNDIGASVDTVASGNSPVVWQLVSAPRQSLLTPGGPGVARSYLDQVDFRWHVQRRTGTKPGADYSPPVLYLSGWQRARWHDSGVSRADPIVAIQPRLPIRRCRRGSHRG